MITVSLRFDEETKKQLDEMCEAMGLSITTFFMIYAKKVLRDRKIPFEIAAPADSSLGYSRPHKDAEAYNDDDLEA